MAWIRRHTTQLAGHVMGLAPLGLLAYWYATGALDVNPIRELVLRSGRYAAALLILTLVPTVIRTVTGYGRIIRLRGLLGLYAFGYACAHLLLQVGLDYQFALDFYVQDVLTKRYGLAGLAAFLLLLPVAVTSTRGWMRRLGGNWRRLHRLVYLGAAVDVLHYVWTVKAAPRVPYFMAAVLALLLIMRLPPVRRVLVKARR